MSCWGRGPATGSQSPPLPRGKGAALFFFMKLEGAFFWFSMIRQRTHTCRGAGRLCPLWLGVRSLHSFQDSEATYQEVMELEALLSYHENLGGSSLLFLLEHEVDDFCFFFKVEQTSLFEGLHPFFERMLSSSFEEVEGIVRISFPYLERKRSLLAD